MIYDTIHDEITNYRRHDDSLNRMNGELLPVLWENCTFFRFVWRKSQIKLTKKVKIANRKKY